MGPYTLLFSSHLIQFQLHLLQRNVRLNYYFFHLDTQSSIWTLVRGMMCFSSQIEIRSFTFLHVFFCGKFHLGECINQDSIVSTM